MCQEAGFALCGQFPINLIMSTVKGTQESTLNVDSSVVKPLPSLHAFGYVNSSMT